jgi:hypothetical protein
MDEARRKELLDLLWGPGRWVIFTLLGVTLLWVVGALLLGVGHRKPKSVEGILTDASRQSGSSSYVMEYQSLRRISADEDELITGVHANVQVDTTNKAYVMDVAGLTRDGQPLHVQHAHDITIYTTPSFGDSWVRAPDLRSEDVAGFSPAQMLKMKPELLRSTGQYRSTQSWVLRIKPTGDQLSRLLWGNELNLTGSTSAKEAKALHDGNFALTWGYVWVGYDSERLLAVDLKFKIDHGAEYRVRMKYGGWGTIHLKGLKLRPNSVAPGTSGTTIEPSAGTTINTKAAQ